MKRVATLVLIGLGLCAVPRTASAESLTFSCYQAVSAANCDTLEAQMSVDITQSGNWLNFKFANTGPSASFIDGLYFNDPPPSLLGGAPVFTYSGSGISFAAGCAPGDLPNNWGTTYCSDANAPSAKNGVNPSEWVQIAYLLQNPGTQSLATVIDGIHAGTFDIGIKVQGFADGGSEWAALNDGRAPVPEPATLALFMAGATAAGIRRHRSSRKKTQ